MGCGNNKGISQTEQPQKKAGEPILKVDHGLDAEKEIENEFTGKIMTKKGELISKWDRNEKPDENNLFILPQENDLEVKPLNEESSNAQENNPNPPDANLELSYVNGYRCEDSRNNLFFSNTDNEIVYMTAAIGIIHNTETNQQKFLGSGNAKNAIGHTDDIISLSISFDRTLVATGQIGQKPMICIWNLSNGNLEKKIIMEKGLKACKALAWSKDKLNIYACTMDEDHTVHCYTVNEGQLLWKEKFGGEPIVDIDSSFGGTYEFGVVGKRDVALFTKDGKKDKGLFGSHKMVSQLAISFFDNGEKFVTGSLEGSIYLWKGKECVNVYAFHKGPIQSITIVNNIIYSSGSDRKLLVLDQDFNEKDQYILPAYAKALDVKGNSIICGLRNGTIIKIDDKNLTEIIHGHSDGEVWGLAMCPKTGMVITVGDDNKILSFDPKRNKVIYFGIINIKGNETKSNGGASTLSIYPQNQCSRAVSISPLGHVAIGINNGEVHILESISHLNKILFNFKDSKEWIEVLSYSPDGNLLAVGSHDNNIYIYSFPDYKLKSTCSKHNSFITSFDWSKDSKYLRSICGAYELLYFEASTGNHLPDGENELKTIDWQSFTCKIGHSVQGIYPKGTDKTHINGVDKSNKLSLIACGDDWGMVNLYRYPCLEGNTGKSYRAHSCHVVRTKFSEDNHYLYSVGGFDRTLMVWKLA